MPDTLAPQPLSVLSEEEELFRSTVREFAETAVRPHVQEMDEAARFKPELIQQFFELGLMGIEVPEQYGGAGGISSWPRWRSRSWPGWMPRRRSTSTCTTPW